MKLTISNENSNQIISVDIPGSLALSDFKAYLEAETDIAPAEQILRHNGRTLQDESQQLDKFGITDDDLIVLSKLSVAPTAPTAASSASAPNNGGSASSYSVDGQVETQRQQFLNNPTLNNQLRQSDPRLHSLLNDPAGFKDALLSTLQQLQQQGFSNMTGRGAFSSAQQEELSRLQENPDDPESQAKILELIRQEQIDENMQLAYDISPESFTSITMLYIDIKVNGHKVQAFVDSGAQTTIISPRLAEECGIDRLIDKRYQGEARGVGSQKIEGKIHSVPISIGDSEFEIPCSFVVLNTQVDLLFGLDMLRRHKCVIDLQKDSLIVAGQIETKFLAESEIKSDAFGGGQKLGGNGGGSSGLGGNIFSDAGVPVGNSSGLVPANSTPTPNANSNPVGKSTARNAAAEAASKRQNTGPSASQSQSTFKQEDINQLTSLGFSEQEAKFALEQCKGNVEMAASLLFQ